MMAMLSRSRPQLYVLLTTFSALVASCCLFKHSGAPPPEKSPPGGIGSRPPPSSTTTPSTPSPGHIQPEPQCDLSPIIANGLSIEGQSPTDPNRIFLNERFTFVKGQEDTVNGVVRKSIVITEFMQVVFARDWFAEGVNGLAAIVKSRLPDSCTIGVNGAQSAVSSYIPPTFFIQQGLSYNLCKAEDYPCGLPETTCHGGSAGSPPYCDLSGCHDGKLPEAPTCTTTAKMCRMEQKVPILDATVNLGFGMSLSVSGDPPSQVIDIGKIATRDDIATSQGDLLNMLHSIGLGSVVDTGVHSFTDQIQKYINQDTNVLATGVSSFPIPSSDYIYLPRVRSSDDLAWTMPTNSTPAASKLAISLKRDMTLEKGLTCKLAKCLQQSRDRGVLLIQSCSIL